MARRRTKTSSFSTLGIPSDEELEHFEMDYEARFRSTELDLGFEERQRKSRHAKRRRRKKGGDGGRDEWYRHRFMGGSEDHDYGARSLED